MFAEQTGGANGLKFGPDGTLYACANSKKQIVAYDAEGKAKAVAEDVNSNDLTVNNKGDIYFTDPGNRQIWLVSKAGEKDGGHGASRGQTASRSRPIKACCSWRTRRASSFTRFRFSRMARSRTSSATFTCTCPMARRRAARTA